MWGRLFPGKGSGSTQLAEALPSSARQTAIHTNAHSLPAHKGGSMEPVPHSKRVTICTPNIQIHWDSYFVSTPPPTRTLTFTIHTYV